MTPSLNAIIPILYVVVVTSPPPPLLPISEVKQCVKWGIQNSYIDPTPRIIA